MESNTHSNQPPQPSEPPEWLEWPEPQEPPEPQERLHPPGWLEPPELPEDLAELAAGVDKLAGRDLVRSSGPLRVQRAKGLRWLADRLEGEWLKELAGLDALGAASADHGAPAPSTASWLRRQLRMGAAAAHDTVRTARALFRGPLPQTADALTSGRISPAHARVLANGTRHLPDQVAADAEPVLLEAASRLDPALLRQAVGYLVEVADPKGAEVARQRRHDRRGLWLAPTLDDMVAVKGLLEPEAGHIVRAALEPLARPADANDDRNGDQRNADALAELCRRSLEGGWLSKAGGVRPQLLVTVDLDSLLGRPGGLGGDTGWAGPLDAEACRRLGCDGAVTRVLVSRQPGDRPRTAPPHLGHGDGADHDLATGHNRSDHPGTTDHGRSDHPGTGGSNRCGGQVADGPTRTVEDLQGRLRAAMALLPPTLGGAPSQPLDLGRSTRVISPAQRSALAVRDRGCVFPGCDRPLAWCDAHHLWHWIDGGPTDLANLALLCRAHHRTVHEGGWQLTRGPDGRFSAIPPDRRHRAA
jgi:hypothetical protein